MLHSKISHVDRPTFSYYVTVDTDLDVQFVLDTVSDKMSAKVQIENQKFIEDATGKPNYWQAVLIVGAPKLGVSYNEWSETVKDVRHKLDEHFGRE